MKKNNIFLIILATVLLALVGITAFSYTKAIKVRTEKSIEMRMEEITSFNKSIFELQMDERIKKVEALADYLGQKDNIESADSMELLRTEVKNNGLLRCAIMFPDGNFITSDSKSEGNISESDFFIQAMNGVFTITDPQPSVVDPSKQVITLAGPIQKDGKIIGGLAYTFLCDDLNSLFQLSFMEGQGKILVAKKDGQVLMGNALGMESDGNILDYFRENCTHNGHDVKTCAEFRKEKGNYFFTGANVKDTTLISYSSLKYNDWCIFSLVPKAVAGDSINYVAEQQRNLGILVGICILFYLAIAVILWSRAKDNTDKLTGGKTLESFKRDAKRILKKNKEQRFVIVKLDVRNFKLINRIYDYEVGDRLIINISRALKRTLEGMDAVFARVGIDDFIILLPYVDKEVLGQKRESFTEAVKVLMGTDFSTNLEFPTGQYVTNAEDGHKPDIGEIFEKANFAHRAAKRTEGKDIIDYEETIEKEAIFQQEIEDKMIPALENDEFALYLQPKYRLPNEELCGAEALVRWSIKDMIYVYPTDFVPVFERNGFIVKIDLYMFTKTVQFIRTLLDAGMVPPVISVNFSRYHLDNGRFVEQLCEIADEYQVPHNYLEIELTETVICESVELITHVIDKIHKTGFKISMDDFGSGYSSLGLLKDLDVDVIKIDQKFFGDSFSTSRAKTVVESLIQMAKKLEVVTVAEGVETKEIVDTLKEMGCDIIQGYYFSRPMPEKDMLNLLQKLQVLTKQQSDHRILEE